MKLFQRFRLLIVLVAFSGNTANCQTLEEVLSSIQERKQILEQAQAFIRGEFGSPNHLYPNGPAGTFELISWTGSPAFPTNGTLGGLGIETQIRLLNEARRHFQIIRAGFVNVAPERIDGTEGIRPPAVIRRYDELSLPTPPVANHLNYLGVLRELACKVDAMRVTPWPVNYTLSRGRHVNNPLPIQTEGADKIQWSEMNSTSTVNRWFWAPEWPVIASFKVGGYSHEANTGTKENPVWDSREHREVGRVWPSEFTLSFLPQEVSLPAGVTQIEGTCVALAELRNSPYLAASGVGTEAVPIPQEGGYKRLATRNSAGTQEIEAPQWVVSGAWVSTGEQNSDLFRAQRAFKPTLAATSPYDSFFSAGYPEKYSCVEQAIIFLMIPSFSKGIDTVNEEDERTDYQWDLPRVPGDPGQVAVSGGSVKLGIDVGHGDAMLVPGSLQIQHGWTKFPGLTGGLALAPLAHPAVLWGHPNESTEYLDFFTDKRNHQRVPLSFGTQLRFAGPERDYQVLYETRFNHGRASLKNWPVDSLIEGSHGWQHGMAYYWEWQKPRLRQVLGREALIDVAVGANDYAHAISVYRIPTEHTVTYDSEGFVVTTGLLLMKTVTLGNPSSGELAFPTADLQLAIGADGGDWSVKCDFTDLLGYPTDWSVRLVKSGTSTVLLDELSSTFVDYFDGDPENPEFNFVAMEAPVVDTEVVVRTTDGEVATETTRTVSFESLRSLCADPLPRVSSILVEAAEESANTELDYATGANAPDFPIKVTSNISNEPETVVQMQSSGLYDFFTRGTGDSQWKTEWDVLTDGRLVATSTFGGATNVYGRNWFKWDDGGWSVTTYSAPDGSTTDPDSGEVSWSKLETGRIVGSGFPGLPHRLTHSDDTGTIFAWTIGTDGAGTLVATDGKMSGSGVTNGTATTLDFNAAGHPTRFVAADVASDLQLAGTTGISFTVWGAPLSAEDYATGLLTAWTYQSNLSRLTTIMSPLGLLTEYSAFDALDRIGEVKANGITATNTFAGTAVTTDYSGTNIQAGTQSSTNRDALGRLLSSNTTWNGVSDNLEIEHGASDVEITRTVGPYGTHTSKIRQADGSPREADGPTLPFGGVQGDGLSVSGGLLVSKTEIAVAPGTFAATHTDAWGRVRKVVTPSKSGVGTDTTHIHYSAPDSSVRRVITTEPSGRVLIAESDPYNSSGAITRSGIDVNQSGTLGASDRFVDSSTSVSGNKLVTTLSLTENSGLREILRTEWTPAGNVTVTKINGNQETITRTPNYSNKTVKTESTKGWEKTESFNNLGLTTSSALTGPGIPTSDLTPVWRADGSLASVSLDIGGDTHSASFKSDGTLGSLTAPGRGNILSDHTINNGIESLTADGVTTTRKLDGTQNATSGPDVIAKTEALSPSGGGFRHRITPVGGAVTDVMSNAAGTPTTKTYAVDTGTDEGVSGETRDYYPGGLLQTITLARGGDITFGYSNDGAKDLTSATWPALPSGPFTFPTIVQGYGYDRAGRVNSITDASGIRGTDYANGRLVATGWSAGLLKGYQLFNNRDTTGRDTGTTLKLDGATLHSVEKAPTGLSDQITALASGNIVASPQRDAAGRIIGYVWSDGTNTVTQEWIRGAGGRIEFAGSDVSGSPTFNYAVDANSFDSRGRRLKCTTAGGNWNFQYTGGQLTSAIHPTLGSFTYQFDGIGRRKNHAASTNQSDLLNRTIDWKNNQNKTLKVSAAANARVWLNGDEIPNFTGQHNMALTPPGGQGGWISWNTLAILEGEGDPGANPDAKAYQSGAVWIPPIDENFEYDLAGNRQSSALWDYGWDAKNQLARARTKNCIATPGNPAAPQGWDIHFTHDAEGRRVTKRVNEYRLGVKVAEKHITFIWDGWNLLYERHQLPSGLTLLERKYLWGPDIADGAAGGAGGLLLITESKGNTTTDLIPLYDGTGHVVALTDIEKNLLATYAHGPFGEKISATGPHAQSNPWRYATKYFDEETGLYYFGKRYFDPQTGQWLSREPLGESVSLNLYSYCHNDPVNKVDVLGLKEFPILNPTNPFVMKDGVWHRNEIMVHAADWFWQTSRGILPGTERVGRKAGPLDFHGHYLDDGHWYKHGENKALAKGFADLGWDLDSGAELTGIAAGSMTALVTAPMAIASGITAAPALYTAGYVKATGASIALQSSPWGVPIVGGALTSGAMILDGEDPGTAIASGGMQALTGRAMSAPINWSAMRPANLMPQNLFPSYGGRPGFAPGMVINLSNWRSHDMVKYGDKRSGFQNHHGIMDKWASENVPGYVSRAKSGPATQLSILEHDATRRVFNEFSIELTGKPVARLPWQNISPRQIHALSERMFDAAGVSEASRAEYYRSFNKYLYTGSW